MENEKKIQKICQIILQSENPLIKESDLLNLIGSEGFTDAIRQTVQQFQNLGLSLIRTTYLGEKYYVLTGPGKDEKVSPSMYGILVCLLALYNELGNNIELLEVKKIFKDMWDEVQVLMELNYLAQNEENGVKILELTPIGKAACKNIAKDVNLKNLLSYLEPNQK